MLGELGAPRRWGKGRAVAFSAVHNARQGSQGEPLAPLKKHFTLKAKKRRIKRVASRQSYALSTGEATASNFAINCFFAFDQQV